MKGTIQGLWNEYGLTDYALAFVKMQAQDADNCWIFAKGPSFNKDFDQSKVKPTDFVICVNESVEYMPLVDLVVTTDNHIRKYLQEHGYSYIMMSASHPDWPIPQNSSDLAFILAGECGVKRVNAVGVNFDTTRGNGYEYQFKSGEGPEYAKHALKAKRSVEKTIHKYNLEVTYY